MSKYEDFKSDIKSFSSGQKRQTSVEGRLSRAFKASNLESKKDEKKWFKEILKTVASTPEGRQTLDELAPLGYTFAIETGNFGGACCSAEKIILLNQNSGFKDFSRILVHEARHAIQATLLNCNGEYRISDFYKMNRAIEADACAHESAYVYQIKDTHPDVYEEHKNTPMFKAYESVFEETKDPKKAMVASFKAWYSYDYFQTFYDKNHGNYIKRCFNDAMKRKTTVYFKNKTTSKEILNACVLKGKPYISAAFLEAPLTFSLPEKDKVAFTELSKKLKNTVPDATFDTSFMSMYSRTVKGKILATPSLGSKTR